VFTADVVPVIFDEVLAQDSIDIEKYAAAVEMENKLSFGDHSPTI
jgi:hypothetical protein